ncbi:MAG: sulfite exporter TauE/SafE family protein [Gammaproteobacteria bacterium]|nr:sulfite exporter TauE/SafE family protein [Gammaproteobacteria bacterium]
MAEVAELSTTLSTNLSTNLSVGLLLVIALCAFLTGMLHGATGMAGGVVMAAILSHLLGIKVAIPVMTCALVISHSSRVFIYRKDTSWITTRTVLFFGLPTTAVGAFVFTYLDPAIVAFIFALFLATSIPIKWWARRNEIRTGPAMPAGASVVWGGLAGNVVGPGFFLAPFLLGTGMNRLSFAGTLATVTLAMNFLKMLVFGSTSMLNQELFMMGIGLGLITIPGNWLGSRLLRNMTDKGHGRIVDFLTLCLIVNFFYLAIA